MPITFSNSITKYAVGRRGNMEEWNTISRTFETAPPAVLPFGAPVQRGAGEHGVVAFTTGDFLGIAEASFVLPHPGDHYEQYDTVGVCEVGVIGVLVGTPVTQGTPARWNATTQRWVTTAPGAGIYAVPGAEFETDGPAESVQLVRLRRTVPAS